MVNFIAENAWEIATRLKQIREEEGPAKEHDVDKAVGRDLRILANRYGVKWVDNEADHTIRARVRQALGPA